MPLHGKLSITYSILHSETFEKISSFLKVSDDCLFYSSDIMVLLSPLFFCRFIKEVCYSVNCLMSKYIPFLSRIYFICNLHPHTFHPHETHLDYNYTFPQGSSMILIFAMCPGRWMRTKGMGASKSLHKSSHSVRSRMWWPYHKVLFFLSLFVCFSKRRITIILRKPDFS